MVDMENQVKANNIRIQLLENQNDGLRNSIMKLRNMQQTSPQPEPWAIHVKVYDSCGRIFVKIFFFFFSNKKSRHT